MKQNKHYPEIREGNRNCLANSWDKSEAKNPFINSFSVSLFPSVKIILQFFARYKEREGERERESVSILMVPRISQLSTKLNLNLVHAIEAHNLAYLRNVHSQ